MVSKKIEYAFFGGVPLIQVPDPDAPPRHLVFVRGANSTTRRANFLRAARDLTRLVQRHMARKDERTRVANAKTRTCVNTVFLQPLDFGQQRLRGDDDTIAKIALNMLVENARRD